ncbi:G2/mitotic-specific cyclin-A [Tribolium madens]|uniref:G2/mitotic-specific cyclin-A n=1 Tax=Tribolium madens TaxID=41895 RepID=UPI001CF72B9E|nr:G2/mitotic-specific cyclin-A [Tribolium madens]
MASIKIHQDQENRVPELRRKSATTAQQKRGVLGEIDSNKVSIAAPKGKQTRKPTVLGNRVENGQNNENKKNVVVPVAQFEAFTVYEDDEYRARIDERLKLISKSNVYKGTAEDRFITKTELAEIERKKNLEKMKEILEIPAPLVGRESDIPMSVEKSDVENVELKEKAVTKSTNARDVFFEMEEYRDSIFAYLKEHELRHRAKPGYILKQPDVTENMRAVLIDWLVEVTEEYGMQTETLYLAVNFIDRFLSYMSVVRAKLQLVGTAAMFIASKYEEIFPPEVSEFVYITDDTYDKHQMIRMEQLILRVLGFDLSVPTPLTFLNAICISTKQTEKVKNLAMYLSETALLEVEPYLHFLPSVVASSAIALSRHTLGEEAWPAELQKYTGYDLQKLESCIGFLYNMFVKAPNNPQHAIRDKYKAPKYMQVSKISPNREMISFD